MRFTPFLPAAMREQAHAFGNIKETRFVPLQDATIKSARQKMRGDCLRMAVDEKMVRRERLLFKSQFDILQRVRVRCFYTQNVLSPLVLIIKASRRLKHARRFCGTRIAFGHRRIRLAHGRDGIAAGRNGRGFWMRRIGLQRINWTRRRKIGFFRWHARIGWLRRVCVRVAAHVESPVFRARKKNACACFSVLLRFAWRVACPRRRSESCGN